MTNANTSGTSRESRRPEPDLDSRYGRIAISALVAALPYCSESKTAASDASVEGRDRAA
jgi:hypothetical protein